MTRSSGSDSADASRGTHATDAINLALALATNGGEPLQTNLSITNKGGRAAVMEGTSTAPTKENGRRATSKTEREPDGTRPQGFALGPSDILGVAPSVVGLVRPQGVAAQPRRLLLAAPVGLTNLMHAS